LRQILLNLIGNAVKFTETGVVKIVLRLLNPSSEQPRLQFEVIDSGIGMTEQQIQRLFQPFSQADNSTTRRFGGSGLGLLISQRLAAMLGGGITVDSRPGHGSTFRLAIAAGPLHGDPLAAQPATTSTRVANAPATSPDIAIHGRILLVDDGLDNQRLFSHLLRKAGAEVVVADNGRQAVDRAIAARDNTPFDLILMDIQMPDMDGYEATRQLRKNGYRGPILAVTAHAMPQDVQQCLAAGCDAHLSKPIDKASLLNAVAQALASHRDSETGSPR
jgi:CheY-like chemotaxis protein